MAVKYDYDWDKGDLSNQDKLREVLNHRSLDGWELVNVVKWDGPIYYAFWKRQHVGPVRKLRPKNKARKRTK